MDIADRFRNLVADLLELPLSDIVDSAAFVADLGADSLDLVEIWTETERQFQIAVPVADAEAAQTVGEAIAYLQAHVP